MIRTFHICASGFLFGAGALARKPPIVFASGEDLPMGYANQRSGRADDCDHTGANH
jgi:hypothetical protein